MKKYKTYDYSIRIEEVECIRETESTLTIVYEWSNGQKKEKRHLKNSTYCRYHDTYKDARNYLIRRCEDKIESAESTINEQKRNIEMLGNK